MTYYFYDTSALLDKLDDAFNEAPFLISNITLKEIETIKTSSIKDEEIKQKARRLVRLLDENQDKIIVINYQQKWNKQLTGALCDNADSRIILCAKHANKTPLIFLTTDLSCRQLAKSIGLNTEYKQKPKENYTGYKEILMSDEAVTNFYAVKYYQNRLNLLPNQYMLVKNIDGEIIDKFKLTPLGEFERVMYPVFDSKIFGKIKPKDAYQQIAMDSLKTNKITVLRGPAGTGKSYLAIGYLFDQLERGKIDRIIIFCNTVATLGSAKLGFYPGSKDEKLLDSQIGNFLTSKLGDKIIVENLINAGKLILLPISDCRGYDTTNMKAGVYITEAQNMSVDMMKLVLQRIGEDCICILDGDDACQVDMNLYAGYNNGLKRVSEVFRGEDIYGEVTLVNIYRSKIAEIAEKMK